MANLPETISYDAGIYQIETTDPVLGGPNGIANAQAKALANRTAFLKQQIDQLNSGQLAPAWIASQTHVQEQLQKLDAKQSVRAATTENITLSGVQTIDGVVLTVGDRVLVKNQTAAAQNGIYLVAAQSWTRATDADDGAKLTSSARVAIENGSINAGKVWYLATTGVISVGTTALLFSDEHPYASETANGFVRLSTQADVDAAVSKDTAVAPDKLASHYRKGNILGAVSQAGGAPTGAIIERGSNANGNFTKFADGTMICCVQKSFPGVAVAAGAYAQMLIDGVGSWPHAVPFVGSPPTISVTNISGHSFAWMIGIENNSVSTWGSLYQANVGRDTWSDPKTLNFKAIGRWY